MSKSRFIIFLTNDEASLKIVLSQQFPEVPQLLSVWHVNKNVQTEASKLWKVNNASGEENIANQEKREESMTTDQVGEGKLRTTLHTRTAIYAPSLP
jgi:hypothetical protein